jgi:ArsR family transcriptional regulator
VAIHDAGKVEIASESIQRYEDQGRLARLRQILCDPARLRIVAALSAVELSVSDLALAIGRRVPATSQHLRVLRQLRVVTGQRRANVVYYQLQPGPTAAEAQAVLRAVAPSPDAST